MLLARASSDQITQVDLEFIHCPCAASELLGRQYRLERTKDYQRPVTQWSTFILGHAQHIANQLKWNCGRKIAYQVDSASLRGSIQQTIDKGFDPRLQRLHARGVKAGARSFRTRL